MTESNLNASKLQNQLDAVKQDAKVECESLERELSTVRASLEATE